MTKHRIDQPTRPFAWLVCPAPRCPLSGEPVWVDAQNTYCSRSCAASQPRPGGQGSKSANWSGNHPSYRALHLRVVAERGRADHCIVYGCDTGSTTYQWANISGEYKDVGDFMPMCVPHHYQYDAQLDVVTA